MSDLLPRLLNAHGGLAAWNKYSRIVADVAVEGDIWGGDKASESFADAIFDLSTREATISLSPKTPGFKRARFDKNVMTLENAAGNIVETQYNPRFGFDGTGPSTQWDDFHLAYLCSYSVWVALTQPFIFNYPSFEIETLTPAEFNGEACERLRVTFPTHIASHSRTLISHIGSDGLVRRQDWHFDALGKIAVTSFPSDYRDFQGIKLPTVREMYFEREDRPPEGAPVLACIRVNDVKFS